MGWHDLFPGFLGAVQRVGLALHSVSYSQLRQYRRFKCHTYCWTCDFIVGRFWDEVKIVTQD